MTIDERIEALTARHEALTARHEALTMTVELISRDVESLRQAAASDGKRIDALLTAVEQDAENIRGLARIAEIHERRLSHLEGQ